NFIESKFEGRFVEFPEFEPACHSDPAWGVNPEATYDCGSPKDGYLKKAAWKGMSEEWPAAYAFLQRVNFTNPQIAEAAAMVDVEGMAPEEAATKWIENNEAVWQTWVAATN
ncbi:MAG TPA: glycine betaine ABC transporter substrate-binding protein, partial [Kiloniellales bacterium]|nr:glycine betaine ABC transporter substrate-binding protein [Kiloniellales bacterium]